MFVIHTATNVTSSKLLQQRLRRRDKVADIVHVLLEFGYRLENRNLSLDPPGEFPLQKFLLATAQTDQERVVMLSHRDEVDVDLNTGWELVAAWDLDTGKPAA